MQRSTVVVWSGSPDTGTGEGEAEFAYGLRLRVREELDSRVGLITAYGYEVYREQERLCWYDDFPHPHDVSLAETYPHHKQFPPDIRRHRVPAPGLSYERRNLPLVVREVLDLAHSEPG